MKFRKGIISNSDAKRENITYMESTPYIFWGYKKRAVFDSLLGIYEFYLIGGPKS